MTLGRTLPQICAQEWGRAINRSPHAAPRRTRDPAIGPSRLGTVKGNAAGRLSSGMPQSFKDPVCGMAVDPRRAAAKGEYAGGTVYFCSTGCKAAYDRQHAPAH